MRRHVLMMVIVLASAGALAEDYEVKMKERTHGCRSPEETYKFWSLARHNKDAAAKYSNEKGCRIFAQGETVALVDRNPTTKINAVRPKNEKVVYYVPAADAN